VYHNSERIAIMMLIITIIIPAIMIQDQSSQLAVIIHTLALQVVIAAVIAIAKATIPAAISSNRAYHEHYQN
jgi:formate hydrogenlyase subunit 4